jgi:hypothetical protein
MRVLHFAVTVSIALWVTVTSSVAQNVTGKWDGSIENWTRNNPRRTLVISGSAPNASCTWGSEGEDFGAKTCTITGGVIELVNATSAVHLELIGDTLRGEFMPSGSGQSFPITMRLSASSLVLNTCEQSIPYAIQVPGSGVRESSRAFSGAWVGGWDTSLCSALIIERIDSDGTARGWYINGRLVRVSASIRDQIQPDTIRIVGRISGNKLTLPRPPGSIVYTLASPTQLYGVYSLEAGQHKGAFTKK